MSEISVVGNAVVGNVRGTAPATPIKSVEVTAPCTESNVVETTDSVEFSAEARLLEKIQQLPSVRQERIDAIKSAIATNTYLTNDKLELALNRMIDETRD